MDLLSSIAQGGLVILGHILFWLVVIISIAIIPVGLPGAWAMVVTALLFAIATGFEQITWFILFVLLAAAALGELIEFLGGMAGARYGGAGKWGMVAATVGGLVGAVLGTIFIPVPVIGSVIGAFSMCFLSVLVVEFYRLREYEAAMRAGFWAFAGRVFSVFAKTGIAAGMAVGLFYALYIKG